MEASFFNSSIPGHRQFVDGTGVSVARFVRYRFFDTFFTKSAQNGTQGSISRAVKGLLYPVGSISPFLILVPLSSDTDLEPEDRCWVQDLSTDRWFPFGSHSHRMIRLSGTPVRLRNHYTIISAVVPMPFRCPNNQSLRRLGIRGWRGNVLVLRNASRNYYEVTNVHSAERSLIDFAVVRYVAPDRCSVHACSSVRSWFRQQRST